MKLVTVIILAGLLLGGGLILKFNFDKTMKADKVNNSVGIPLSITDEELAQGWYWGETKRLGTPDTWALVQAGTRGARWTDTTRVSQ